MVEASPLGGYTLRSYHVDAVTGGFRLFMCDGIVRMGSLWKCCKMLLRDTA